MPNRANILVTGGSGLLGRYVVDELAETYRVTVLDLRAPHRSDVGFREVDVLDLDAVAAAVEGCDAVLHLAGLDFAATAPAKAFFEINVQGTWNVFHAAERAAVPKVVYCSSEAALGLETLEQDLPPISLPFGAQHPLRPTDTYALTKQVSETVALSYVRRGRLNAISLRPTAILFDSQIRWAVASGLASDPTALSDLGGRPEGDEDQEDPPLFPCYVRPDDTARCFRLALESRRCEAFEVFYVSAADTFSVQPTLCLLAELYGRVPEIRQPALFEDNPFASLFDIARTRDKLGWAPTGDWLTLLGEKAPDCLDLFRERRSSAVDARA